jgi:hypothetical protein
MPFALSREGYAVELYTILKLEDVHSLLDIDILIPGEKGAIQISSHAIDSSWSLLSTVMLSDESPNGKDIRFLSLHFTCNGKKVIMERRERDFSISVTLRTADYGALTSMAFKWPKGDSVSWGWPKVMKLERSNAKLPNTILLDISIASSPCLTGRKATIRIHPNALGSVLPDFRTPFPLFDIAFQLFDYKDHTDYVFANRGVLKELAEYFRNGWFSHL